MTLGTGVIALGVLVFIVMPVYSIVIRWLGIQANDEKNMRAFNFPNGSIRAMLALMSVGAFVLFLVIGPGDNKTIAEHYSEILTAFGTLNGAILGFYFGGRAATPPKQ